MEFNSFVYLYCWKQNIIFKPFDSLVLWHNYIIVKVFKRKNFKFNENGIIDNRFFFTTYNTDQCW